MSTLSNKLGITTSSLGYDPAHTLDHKIHAASAAGYQGMEISFGDLAAYATARRLSLTAAAEQIRQLCASLQITIISLCPFENYEGSLIAPLEQRLRKAGLWVDVARVLGALHIQIPSQFSPDSTGDEDVLISELRALADLAAAGLGPTIKIAYEPLSWGLYCSTWQKALEYAVRVDRPNFGLCLDTFHEMTKLWGSPVLPGGRYADGPRVLEASLRQFVKECPLDKIFYVQLSDGELLNPPVSESHPWYIPGEAPEFTWSKHARPFPLETEYAGYLPCAEVVRAWILEKEFTGWVTMEIFDRRMRDPAYQPEHAAARGLRSWQKLARAMDIVSVL